MTYCNRNQLPSLDTIQTKFNFKYLPLLEKLCLHTFQTTTSDDTWWTLTSTNNKEMIKSIRTTDILTVKKQQQLLLKISHLFTMDILQSYGGTSTRNFFCTHYSRSTYKISHLYTLELQCYQHLTLSNLAPTTPAYHQNQSSFCMQCWKPTYQTWDLSFTSWDIMLTSLRFSRFDSCWP